jgi:hypothetical protein
MRTPVVALSIALAAAILLSVSLLVATGTPGEGANPVVRVISPNAD